MDQFSMPILAFAYALIVSPLLLYFTTAPSSVRGIIDTPGDNKIVWPVLAAITVFIVFRNRSRQNKFTWPPNIICLLAYLALAAASSLWAFSPQTSVIRFIQQIMVVTTVVLPSVLTERQSDLMRGLFSCIAVACILNVGFVISGDQTFADNKAIGYSGYFLGKNYLGEFAAVAFFLSLHEVAYPGRRRAAGIFIGATSILLMIFANSKTAIGLSVVVPLLGAIFIMIKKITGISPAIVFLLIIFCFEVFSLLTGFTMNRVSYIIYGDSSFTGRQIIWDFVSSEIARKPLLGWGYQSFWLIGPTGPSITDAPGWVKDMPNAHSGYFDTTLELGYLGLFLLVMFIVATLHGIGRMAEQDAVRAWGAISIVLFAVIHNGLESLLFRGFEFAWVIFLVVCCDISRYWQPIKPAYPVVDRAPSIRRSGSRPIGLRTKAVARLAGNEILLPAEIEKRQNLVR